MRYAIVSDIHANLQAWNAVLLDIRSQAIDRIVCLGDIVGYGPNPAEVLESVHANVDHVVLGNHDAVICDKMDVDMFNDVARDIILWTRDQLTPDATNYLASLPLSLAGHFFRCTHAEFSDPAMFDYIFEPKDTILSWETVKEQLLFVGHTHRSCIHLLGRSGTPRMVEAQDFVLQPEKRFLVNVGSVGQPRDGDARACYCLFDTAESAIWWRRIPFDIDAYRVAIESAGISQAPSYFLRYDPRRGVKPLREMVNFSPARTKAKAARNVIPVQQLKALKRNMRRWRYLAAGVAATAFCALAVGGGAWWRHAHRALTIRNASAISIAAATVPALDNILSIPAVAVASGRPVVDWSVELGHRGKQSVAVIPLQDMEQNAFLLRSATGQDEILLRSLPIRVAPGMRMTFQALFKKAPGFAGNVFAAVALSREIEGRLERTELHATKEPNLRRKDDWWAAKHTFEIPANATEVAFCIRGNFVGSVVVKDVSLVRRE
jgi:predicted phosphodiesterase